MLLTEEQAKTKWCPKAAQSTPGDSSWNRYEDGRQPHNCNCIASACMAWRSVKAVNIRRPAAIEGFNDLEWIKEFRSLSGCTLREAKEEHDSLLSGQEPARWSALNQDRGYCGAFGTPSA